MAIKTGTTLLIKNNTAQVEDLTDVSISFSKQIIDTTTKDSNFWRDVLPGTRSATINATAYVDYSATEGYDEIISDFNSNTAVAWEITTDVTGDSNITGNGHVASIEKTGTLDGVTTYSYTVEVTGAVTLGTEA